MPLSLGSDDGFSDPDALAAIARRLTLAGAPMTPTASPNAPSAGLTYSPPPPVPTPRVDPFRFLAPVGNAIGAVGNAFGGAMQAAQNVPVLGGALQGLGAVANQTIGPGLGLLEKTAGDGAAQQAFNANYQTLGGDQPSPFDFFATTRALNAAHQASMGNAAATASDTSKSGLERALAGIQYGADQVAQNTLPVPGLGLGADIFGSLARRVGGAAEDAASAAARDASVVRPVYGDVARAAQNSEAVRASGRFQFTAPDAAPADLHAPTDIAPPTDVAPAAPNPNGDFRQQIADSQAQQHANPTPVGELANRAPISARDPGTGTFAQPATPHLTTDATLNADLEASLRARGIEPPAAAPFTKRAPSIQTNMDELRLNALKQRIGGPASTGGTAPESVLGGKMLGNESGIVGASARGESWVTPELMAKHYANEALTNAAKSGDVAAARDALATLEQHGASASNTASHLRAAGVSLPRGATFADIRESLMPKPATDMPPLAPRAPRASSGLPEQLNAETLSQRTGAPDTLAQQATNDALRRAVADRTGTGTSFDTVPGSTPKAATGAASPSRQAILQAGYRDGAARGISGDALHAHADAYLAQKAGPGGIFGGRATRPVRDTSATPALADNTGGETIAQAKQRLAQQMGVDANTGMPLKSAEAQSGTSTTISKDKAPLTMARVARAAENIGGAGKTLTTAAAPPHFLFRAALPETVAHPIAALTGGIKGLGEGFRMTPQELAARQAVMRADPLTHDYGLFIGKPHGGIVSGEDAVPSTFLNRLPVIGKIIERSGQGYVQGLNEVRYEVAKSVDQSSRWLADRGWVAPMSSTDKMRMGETINTFTGHGIDTQNMGEAGKTTMRALNVPMMSPQLAAARVKMLGYTAKGLADVAHNIATGRPIDAVALERARLGIGAMVGVGGLYMLASGIGGKLDTNPISATAGQVDMGKPSPTNGLLSLASSETGVGASAYPGKNVMLNPTESESTLLRTIARLVVSIHNEATSGKDGAFGAGPPQSPMDVGMKYLISQLFSSPITYPLAEFLQGYPVSPLDSVTPMPVTAALTGSGTQLPTIGGKAPKGGAYNGPPTAPRANFRFGGSSGTTAPSGTFRFQAPPFHTTGNTGNTGNTGGTGSHMPSPMSGDIPSVIQSTAQQSGIDPRLALAVAQQESGFNPNAVGDNGNSHGLFQENVNGRGYGRAPDLNPVGQTQRFAADVRQFMAQNPNASPGQVAAAVQRPANPAQYAASVDAIYRRLTGR